MPAVAVYGLYIIVTAFVAYGSAMLSRNQSGGIIGWLSNELSGFVKGLESMPVTGAIIDLARWLSAHVGNAFQTLSAPTTTWVSGLNQYARGLQTAVYSLPLTMNNLVFWLIYTHIPNAIKAHTNWVAKHLNAAEKQIAAQSKAIAHTAVATPPVVKRIAKATVPTVTIPHLSELSWINRNWKAIAEAASLAAVAGVAGSLPYGRTIRGIRRRLTRLEKFSLGGLAVGVVGIALARLGIGGTRCNNTQKALKRICGLNPNLLESLLADSLAIFGTISIVEFTKGLQTLTPGVEWGLGHLIDEAPPAFTDVPEKALKDALALIPGV